MPDDLLLERAAIRDTVVLINCANRSQLRECRSCASKNDGGVAAKRLVRLSQFGNSINLSEVQCRPPPGGMRNVAIHFA